MSQPLSAVEAPPRSPPFLALSGRRCHDCDLARRTSMLSLEIGQLIGKCKKIMGKKRIEKSVRLHKMFLDR